MFSFGSSGQQQQQTSAFSTQPNLFGSSTTAGSTSNFGSLFGSTNTGSNLFNTGPSSNLFGNTGSTTNTTANLFGTTTAPTGTNLFGSNTSSSLFGSNASNTLLNTTNSLLCPTSSQQQQLIIQNNQSQKSKQNSIENEIKQIMEMLHKTSINNRFQAIVYNKVNPEDMKLYRIPSTVNPYLWNNGVRMNPDPKSLFPVYLNGYDDLKKRIDVLKTGIECCSVSYKQLKNQLDEIQGEQNIKVNEMLNELEVAMSECSHNFLCMLAVFDRLRSNGIIIAPRESEFHHNLSNIKNEISEGPQNLTQKVDDLGLKTVNAISENRLQLIDYNGSFSINKEIVENIFGFLHEQQIALKCLIDQISIDLHDLQVIEEGLKQEERRFSRLV